jgi:pSer/pThr/pTyr-binding forkhead associated (FHA) protein
MDAGLNLALWILRFAFLALLWIALALMARALLRDVRAASRDPASSLGRLVVVATSGQPAPGAVFALDAVTTLGRDLGSSVVVDDPYASAQHAVLTFRGRAWYVEDLRSTNGTHVNGARVAGVAALTYGDEIQIGDVRLRLERGRG